MSSDDGRPRRRLGAAAALAAAALLASPSAARADLLGIELFNHPDGVKAPPGYGLRIDNGSVQTFNFEDGSGGSMVSMSFFTGPGSQFATIEGTVVHNQSGQTWDLFAELEMQILTNADASDWRSDTSGDLYDAILADFFAGAANHSGEAAGDLKDATFPADRIGFDSVVLNLMLQEGQGDPDFTLPGQEDGEVVLFDFPQGDDVIPFMLVKGFRLTNDDLSGIGWLDPRPPSEQNGGDGLTQDFLFRIPRQPVPEPSTTALLGLGALILGLGRRRRD